MEEPEATLTHTSIIQRKQGADHRKIQSLPKFKTITNPWTSMSLPVLEDLNVTVSIQLRNQVSLVLHAVSFELALMYPKTI